MKALIIGGVRFDMTAVPPQGFALMSDIKVPAQSGGYEWGGSAARAVETLCKIGGIEITFIAKGSNDIVGTSFHRHMQERGVELYQYPLQQFPGAMVIPLGGKRDILLLESPDDREKAWRAFPSLDTREYGGVYSDGKLPLAAIHHFKEAKRRGIPTFLDGCAGRHQTGELLMATRYAVVSSYLCEEVGLSPLDMLEFLKGCGCEIGAVTLGNLGLIFYDEGGQTQYMPSLAVPKVVNSNGAGDVLHAITFHDLLLHPERTWREHFIRGRAAASHALQFNSADRLPSEKDIDAAMQLRESDTRPAWLPQALR